MLGNSDEKQGDNYVSLKGKKTELRYMDIHPWFSAIFTKGNKFQDFLFASLEDKFLQKGIYL